VAEASGSWTAGETSTASATPLNCDPATSHDSAGRPLSGHWRGAAEFRAIKGLVDIVQQRQIEQWILSKWAGGAKPMVLILSHSEAKSETMPYP
jgi:hypothetical protein